MSKIQQPQPKSAYQIAWERLRDVPVGTEVIVECDMSARETLIQAIARIKSQENTARKALDLPSFGPTKVVRYIRNPGDSVCRVGFSLTFSLEQLL